MQRLYQILFVASVLGVSWLAMMAAHELGHVIGAVITHGHVTCVVLHPMSISRTDVQPNPHPAVVVWMGPMIGCLLPFGLQLLIPAHMKILRNSATFFAGFCLLANGAYIAVGSFDRVGDCGEMLRTGTPLWLMITFGVVAILSGLLLWHRLGSLKQFLASPGIITPGTACSVFAILVAIVVAEVLFSPV
jgi:hypothetical protein